MVCLLSQEHRTQLELEKKELETKLEMERVLKEKELLIRDKQLKSVQRQLQTMQEVNTIIMKHGVSNRILISFLGCVSR